MLESGFLQLYNSVTFGNLTAIYRVAAYDNCSYTSGRNRFPKIVIVELGDRKKLSSEETAALDILRPDPGEARADSGSLTSCENKSTNFCMMMMNMIS